MGHFRWATVSDIPALMHFMDVHWRKGHVLSRCEAMWRYEFNLSGDRLNVGLAVNGEEIQGIFGFIPYSREPRPDMAGSLWKVTDAAQRKMPMLGLQLRQWVIENAPHDFFAAPGAGPQTEPIYQLLGMQWHRMQHYFRLNPELHVYLLAKVPKGHHAPEPIELDMGWEVELLTRSDLLKDFPFFAYRHIRPYKDEGYVRWRYFDYPFAHYQVWLAKQDRAAGLMVTRRVGAKGATALRVVDFLGDEAALSPLMAKLDQEMRHWGDEYIDMVAHGLSKEIIQAAGLRSLSLDQSEVVVPNYFEPFEQRNVPVYCVANPTPAGCVYRQFKADGDQDRPNLMEQV